MIGLDQMRQIVEKILQELPDEMRLRAAEITFFIEDWPDQTVLEESGVEDRSELLGFYRGIPLPERSQDYAADLPDSIYLFRRPIVQEAADADAQVERVIRETAIHEIAHFFGYDDEDLDELGLY